MAKRRYGSYTPKRRAALRKAQIASARKRKGRKRAYIAGGVAVGVLAAGVGAGVARHKASGSSFGVETNSHLSTKRGIGGQLTGSRPASLRVERHTKRGSSVVQRRFVFETAKRGPLGSTKSYVYTHNPLFGSRKPRAVTNVGPPASKKASPGKLTPAPAPNRDVRFGTYKGLIQHRREMGDPAYRRRQERVRGMSLDRYLRSLG